MNLVRNELSLRSRNHVFFARAKKLTVAHKAKNQIKNKMENNKMIINIPTQQKKISIIIIDNTNLPFGIGKI